MSDKIEEKSFRKQILRNSLMWKFRFYGFFKNLKFFEPYLIILLLNWGESFWDFPLLHIGTIFLVQEIITYIFEVPSGILADKFGKKNELLVCFVFYIASFILYFFGLQERNTYVILIYFAAVLFGFGEAFRSGTHKAMILTWMDIKEITEYKTFVYGTTRSWSLLGSTISGISSIFIILNIPASNWIFLITIVPYVLDFILIASYPKYMNEHQEHSSNLFKEIGKGFKEMYESLKKKELRIGLFSTSSYDAIYKSLKDYIQPIMKLYIVFVIANLGLQSLGLASEDLITIILGSIYSLFYIFSAISSRNAYRIKKLFNSVKQAMDIFYYLFSILLILNAVFIWLEIPLVVIFLYLFIYIFENIRRPLGVDYLGQIMKKQQRTTILSVEAQIKAILVFIFAPLFGLIADFSIPILFVIIAGTMILVNIFFLKGEETLKEESTSFHSQK